MIVTDESRLQDVWSLQLTTRRGILLSVGVVLAVVVLAAVLIMVTPLRSLLPGYMKEHQRADFIEALLKLDSLQNEYDRNSAPQNAPVNMILDVNAEELMVIANKRLCNMAALETHSVVAAMCREVIAHCPEFEPFLVPMCEYLGGKCNEMNGGCGKYGN